MELSQLLADSFRETDEKLLSWLQSKLSFPCVMLPYISVPEQAITPGSMLVAMTYELIRVSKTLTESVLSLQAVRQRKRRMLGQLPQLPWPGGTRSWLPMLATLGQSSPEGTALPRSRPLVMLPGSGLCSPISYAHPQLCGGACTSGVVAEALMQSPSFGIVLSNEHDTWNLKQAHGSAGARQWT